METRGDLGGLPPATGKWGRMYAQGMEDFALAVTGRSTVGEAMNDAPYSDIDKRFIEGSMNDGVKWFNHNAILFFQENESEPTQYIPFVSRFIMARTSGAFVDNAKRLLMESMGGPMAGLFSRIKPDASDIMLGQGSMVIDGVRHAVTVVVEEFTCPHCTDRHRMPVAILIDPAWMEGISSPSGEPMAQMVGDDFVEDTRSLPASEFVPCTPYAEGVGAFRQVSALDNAGFKSLFERLMGGGEDTDGVG